MTAKPVTAHPRIQAGAVALGVGGNLIAGCNEAIREARGI